MPCQVKVEIGGDSQSTDGTEASHMHARDDLDCNRGYEWWLLEEARARNPQVVTYALSWAVPEWVGNDTYYSDVSSSGVCATAASYSVLNAIVVAAAPALSPSDG